MLTFFAQPYDLDAKGFYFSTFKEYEEKVKMCINSFGGPVEEFEILPIDGKDDEIEILKASKVDQCNLEDVLNFLEGASEEDIVNMFFLMDNLNLTFEDAIDKKDEPNIQKGKTFDAAVEIFDEMYLSSIPEGARNYIDYDSFAHDLRMGGDVTEFEFNGTTHVCTNSNDL